MKTTISQDIKNGRSLPRLIVQGPRGGVFGGTKKQAAKRRRQEIKRRLNYYE